MKLEKQIFEICKQGNISKLKLAIEMHPKYSEHIKKEFEKDIKKISDFCIENFLKTGKITEKFIKTLHKMHFPKGFIQYKQTEDKKAKFAIMVPGNYKTISNFDRVKLSDTKQEMKKLVDNYNKNIDKTTDKFFMICDFLITFFKIHPFGNANGTIGSIVCDLMLIKNNLKPIYFKGYVINHKKELYQSVEDSIKNNDTNYFINFIKNHSL